MRAAFAALAAAALAAQAQAADDDPGERAFQRCYACHSVDPVEDGLPGPNLNGVIGRRAGTLSGYEFSPAMAAAGAKGLVWTRKTLEAFLADPQSVVPGTTMPPLSIDAELRREVIAYLERAR